MSNETGNDIKKRKVDHIGVCLNENVNSNYNYWNDVNLIHNSLPEVNKEDISTEIEFFGKKLNYPLFIAAISGGHSKSKLLNENFAKTASELGIGFCIGSQRAALENPETIKSYSIVKEYDVPLKMATIGGVQLIQQKNKPPFNMEQIKMAMDMIDANALTIFLNIPQEMIQPEGDENASGILEVIEDLAKNFKVNVKECGFGISGDVALLLKKAGVKSIEISGVSGTSWTAVEYYRAKKVNNINKTIAGKTFWNWGIPSTISILECRKVAESDVKIIGSGGIKTGLDVARSIVLGADAASMANAILPYAVKDHETLMGRFDGIIDELKITMLLTGSNNVEELKKRKYVLTGKTAEWKKEI